jgi:hypothetical protein
MFRETGEGGPEGTDKTMMKNGQYKQGLWNIKQNGTFTVYGRNVDSNQWWVRCAFLSYRLAVARCPT